MDFAAEIADWPVGSASVAVVDDSGVRDVLDGGGRYPWASVSKIATALTVLDAAFEGVVDLDDPAGPPGATLRHLLAHASGVNLDDDRILAQPGTRRIYSNRGIELAAEHLGRRTGRAFETDLRERILGPIGLTDTEFGGSPAHGLTGPIDDLAALADELLNGATLWPGVLEPASTVAFPGLAGVLPGFGRQAPNDWGLGCEIRGSKQPHWTSPSNSPGTFGHFGQSGGFLWVDPTARLACVSLSDTAFGPWAAEVWPRLSSRVLETYG